MTKTAARLLRSRRQRDYLVWPLDTLALQIYAKASALRGGIAVTATSAKHAALAVKGNSAVDRYAVVEAQVFDLGDPADAEPDDA